MDFTSTEIVALVAIALIGGLVLRFVFRAAVRAAILSGVLLLIGIGAVAYLLNTTGYLNL